MEYRSLGGTGMKVSELCMGTMQFGWTTDEAHAFEVLDAFVESGGNFIDTATIQVAMPNASLHLAWEWMVHFPGQSSWQDTEAGTVELPFLIDVKCYDTLVTKTFEWGQGWRGALRGDGSATLTPT